MEKRFTLFITLSALILLLHFWLNPPKPQPAKGKNAVAKKEDGTKKGDQVEKDGAEKPEADGAKVGPASPDKKPDDANEKPTPRKLTDAPKRWVTLGSVDPQSGHQMLVTFNSVGATVERVELSSPRYHDLEDANGYLGHLALAMSGTGKGIVVNAVGAGTPAAHATPEKESGPAGLQVGDVIVEVAGQLVGRPADFEKNLAKSKPGDSLKLNVMRGNANLAFIARLTKRPLEVIRPEPDAPLHDPLSFLLTLDTIGSGKKTATIGPNEQEIDKLTSLRQTPWEVTKATNELVEFRFVLDDTELKKIGQSGELEIFKRYRLARAADEKGKLPPKPYHVDLEIEIKSNAEEPHQVAYRLDGPNGLPLEGWWYANKISPYWRGGAGARDVVWRTDTDGHQFFGCPALLDLVKKSPDTPYKPLFGGGEAVGKRALQYVGVDTQYFIAALLPEGEKPSQRAFNRLVARPVGRVEDLKKGREKTLNVGFQLQSEPQSVSAKQSLKQKFTVFLGPKDPPVLAEYNLGSTVELGWWWWVCGPLSWLLHGFYGVVKNYGIAIIMLTIVVRSCMLPISYKMTKNAQKMQALAPELKKLTEKYKNDMEKRSKAQQELFQKHGVNMYSGCVLVFFQLPVFAGLYRLLAVDINLRQAPLIPGFEWCSNLAGPDKFWKWDHIAPGFLADETGWFGPYLNVLPLVTVALFMVNQKLLTPPATDEQQKMQQQIMSFMMIFFAAMFFKVPSGLCLYFIASSLWTLAEHKVLKKNQTTAAAAAATQPADAPTNNSAAIEKREARKKQRR